MNTNENTNENTTENEIIWKLTKDLKKAAAGLDREQARFLVYQYYRMQENRMRSEAQIRAVKDGPSEVLKWFADKDWILEQQISGALLFYAEGQHMGQWAMQQPGIGHILAAGLLAHIDLTPWRCAGEKKKRAKRECSEEKPCTPQCHREQIHTVGHIWRFAGLDPTSKWDKSQLRPWNAALKVLCYKIGDSFVKLTGKWDEEDVKERRCKLEDVGKFKHPEAQYAICYVERKALEAANNEAGRYADQAKAVLARNPTHAQAAIYRTGKLPPGHIHSRARRYAVKLFLSHWHAEAYRHQFKMEPPKPYPIAILGHAHAA